MKVCGLQVVRHKPTVFHSRDQEAGGSSVSFSKLDLSRSKVCLDGDGHSNTLLICRRKYYAVPSRHPTRAGGLSHVQDQASETSHDSEERSWETMQIWNSHPM
jgi:hypothetical protein